MIIRIVKMSFDPLKVDDFLRIFDAVKDKINAFEGCTHVELLKDVNNPNVFFTHSHWVTSDHLEEYRSSMLFRTTWALTKILFIEKPEAWSLQKIA